YKKENFRVGFNRASICLHLQKRLKASNPFGSRPQVRVRCPIHISYKPPTVPPAAQGIGGARQVPGEGRLDRVVTAGNQGSPRAFEGYADHWRWEPGIGPGRKANSVPAVPSNEWVRGKVILCHILGIFFISVLKVFVSSIHCFTYYGYAI